MTKKFAKTLEEKANHLAAYPPKKQWDDSIPSMFRREIALTVDQIQRLRERHEEMFHSLLRLECYVDTDLMAMENRQQQYAAAYNFPEKEQLKQRLFDIEKERRNLSLKLEEKTQNLETRLLELINRHQQLDIR